jgi:hypothetical protein
MPYKVVSPPGSEIHLLLSVVQAATVSGSVVDYGFSELEALSKGETSGSGTPQLQRKAGLGGVVVELSNGHESKRRATGMDGRFNFNEVRPGAWSLAIVSGQLPSYHVVEKPVQEVSVAPGEKIDVEFRVIQERRRIRMINLGEGIVIEPSRAFVNGQVIRLGGTENLEKPVPESEPKQRPPAAPDAGPESARPPASRGPEDIQTGESAAAPVPQETPAVEPNSGLLAPVPQPTPEPAAPVAPQPAPGPAAPVAPQPAPGPAAPAALQPAPGPAAPEALRPALQPAASTALQTAPQTPVEEVAARASAPQQPKPAAPSSAQQASARPAATRPPAAPPARLKPIPIPPSTPAPSPWPLYLPLEQLPDPVYGPLPQQFILPLATPGVPIQR